jgi:DNA-nicking Smr family endonuclease
MPTRREPRDDEPATAPATPAAPDDTDDTDDTDETHDTDDYDADLRVAPGHELLDDDAPVGSPLAGELDLHTFLPRECADLVAEYLRAAQDAGLTSVRIVHGKGTGTLRRIVHGVLDGHPSVRAYRLADERSGSWGATLVDLHPAPAPADGR